MDIEIINTIKVYLDDCHLEYPRIELAPNFKGFTRQTCGMDEFGHEMVKQDNGGGISGDSFTGTIAFPIGNECYIVIEYST